MFDDQTIKQLREVVKDEVTTSEKRLKVEIKDTKKRLQSFVKKELKATEIRIIKEVGDFVNDSLLPQLEEKADKKDLESIKTHLGL